MIYNNIEFFNVSEIEESMAGYRLLRFPRHISNRMGEGESVYGRYVSQTTTGCELRFVLEGDRALLLLSSIDEDGFVQVYRGDFRYYTGYTYSYPIKKGQITAILLTKNSAFEKLDSSYKQGQFSPNVWRILSDINFTMTFNGIETYGSEIRPPNPNEIPSKTLLAYGTSLTYGACASVQSISYIQYLGRLLGCNVLNKAMGGSCMNESMVADYFASGAIHYDAVLLENGVNMSGMPEEYKKNAAYLIDRLSKAHPDIPIYCVTAYPNVSIVAGNKAYPCEKLEEKGTYQNDRILRDIAKEYSNVKIIEGAQMMDCFTDLTCDLVHLSDYGHIRVATNLANSIQI